MIIYKTIPQFDSNTSEVSRRPIKRVKEIRCDFTGVIIDSDEDGCSYPNYILDYEDQDSCFGSGGEEYEFGERYDVDVYPFLSGAYHFSNSSYDDTNACTQMMKALIDKDMDFACMCRYSRVTTAAKLIDEGKITSDSLSEDVTPTYIKM